VCMCVWVCVCVQSVSVCVCMCACVCVCVRRVCVSVRAYITVEQLPNKCQLLAQNPSLVVCLKK